jgi:hypothetical protein
VKSDAKIQFLFQPVVDLPQAPVSIDTTETGEEETKRPIIVNPRLSSDCITRLNSSPKNSEVMSKILKLCEQHQEKKKVLEANIPKGMRHCSSDQDLSQTKVYKMISVESVE